MVAMVLVVLRLDSGFSKCYLLVLQLFSCVGGHISCYFSFVVYLDSCCHFVFRHMLCILFVCLVQVFAYNVVASLGCAVCFRLLVCWAAARDLHCKCIYYPEQRSMGGI